MGMFYAPLPREQSEGKYQPPPVSHDKVFITLRESPGRDESLEAREYVVRYMGTRNFFVRAESDFEYEYFNEANAIRCRRRGWVVSVDSTDFRGRRIIDFVVRFLPSPLYEIEKQVEFDAERRRKEGAMKVAPVGTAGDKKEKVLTDEEIVASYEKARRAAEQNSSIPPSINGDLFASPSTIPVSDSDSGALEKAKERKAAADGKRKERESRMLESMLRNREKIRKAVGIPG